MKLVHLPWKVLGVAFSLRREFYVFANSIRIAPWLWHIFFRGIGCCTVQNFAQSLPCHTTHMKKAPLLWQVPKGMRYHWYRRQRAAVSRSTICLLGVGFSLCRVVFALGQAKFCVFPNFIRIARLLWHFSQGNWLLSLFSCAVFKRMQKICETSPWLVAFERTCSYQFSVWETLKKTYHSHRHLGFLAFSGSISPISPCHCKWLSNVIFLKCWWTPGVSE